MSVELGVIDMYKPEDYVQYGIHGICRILCKQVQAVNKRNVEYYVLEPVDQKDARYYVPVQNEAAVSKLHPILSPSEIEALLHSGAIAESDWISDENLRKQRYREAICSGDRFELIRLIHALYQQKKRQKETGRKMHICDENFLRDARKLLDTELSMVLGIPQSEVGGYVQDLIDVR